jgi:hypothetical protein
MTQGDREQISNPAMGLMVFDTTSQSFWFYNGAWVQLGSSKLLLDSDGNTGIEVEQIADENIVRIKTAGIERMTIDQTGEVRIGDGTNYTKIDSDGSLSFVGSARRWDDLRVPVNTVRTSGPFFWSDDKESAEWDDFRGGTQLIFFPDSRDDNAVYFTVQMPHGWVEGSTILPHVHWTNKEAPGEKKVTWVLEYTWANAGETFSSTSIISGSSVPTGSGTIAQYEHAITPLGAGISATGKTISSMLNCKLSRKGKDVSDTFTGSAGLLEIDFHYLKDGEGSHGEYTKD